VSHVEDRWHAVRDGVKVRTDRYGTGKRWKVRHAAGSQSFARKTDADAFAAEVHDALRRGTYVDPRQGQVTFRERAEGHRARAVHDSATADRVERSLRRSIYPVLGSRPIGAIRTSEIEAWVAKASRELAPSTLRVTFAVVVSVFRSAVRDRIIPSSPCDGVKLPAARPRKVEPPELAVLDRLTDALPPRFRAVVPFVAGSGLRQAEVFGLEVGDVDFLRRHVTVRRQLKTMPGQPPYLDSPKTGESERVVPLAQTTLDVLADRSERGQVGEYEVTDRSDPSVLAGEHEPDRPGDRTPGPVARNEWSAIWSPAARAAGAAGEDRPACPSAPVRVAANQARLRR
jgi:integrase